jgi:hypothetical protein
MSWKHLLAICMIAAFPSLALAQPTTKPTKADVEKVIQLISADKAKVKTYCELQKIGEQMDQLDQKKDAKKLQELDKQMVALEQKLGPEYVKLMKAMESVSEAQDKALIDAFEPLNKMCGKA